MNNTLRIAPAALMFAFAGCAGRQPSADASATTAAPSSGPAAAARPLDEIQRTSFDASLGVRIDEMQRRPSGLYVQDLRMGTGQIATTGRTAVVRYAGWLANGKQFDSGEISVTLGTNKTIRAWEEGLLGMRVGGQRRLVVPPYMGYGGRGAGDVIPPNAVLVFEMELLDVR